MAPVFPLRWHGLQLSKQGNADADYEDASAANVANGRFAVADGASEASFAAIWARLLVDRFVTDPGKPWNGLDWLDPLRKQWASDVDGLSLPWYAEEKRELGAFATFLGLVFRPETDGEKRYWRAIAVGDCCLFHIRGGRLVQAFPIKRSVDFDNRPQLLRSRGTDALEHARTQGHWKTQDRFLLMTDALAQWFLRRLEQKKDPLADIAHLLTEDSPAAAFVDWIADQRRTLDLRNDDVTLVVVDVV